MSIGMRRRFMYHVAMLQHDGSPGVTASPWQEAGLADYRCRDQTEPSVAWDIFVYLRQFDEFELEESFQTLDQALDSGVLACVERVWVGSRDEEHGFLLDLSSRQVLECRGLGESAARTLGFLEPTKAAATA